MKNILKRGLPMVLALIMMVGLLPVTAYAKVDSSGKPLDLQNKLVVSIYTTEGTFPGEPATHGSSEYISFNSSFEQTSASGTFKSSAETELDPSILETKDLAQGAGNGSTKVWGVFSADGLDKYFLDTASITKEENELKIIKAIKGSAVKGMSDKEIQNKYEIIWYVIKLQHNPGILGFLSTTEWHIDGLIREKIEKTVAINYYGNGNTTGSAPDGVTNHKAGEPYTILGSDMTKKINGVDVDFLGWSATPDGSGEFYPAGAVIKPEENVSLYAMWDTNTQYTATVKTYLNGVLADEEDIHDADRDLYLSTDTKHYHQLTRSGEGVYTAKITGNGKFHLYNKVGNEYIQVGDRQLTIYNQDGHMDVFHYTVDYVNPDPEDNNVVETTQDERIYYYGESATVILDAPTKQGYRFLGWEDANDNLLQSGDVITTSITDHITLTAKWEKTVNVKVNVTINHNGGGGYDQLDSKNEVSMALVSRENSDSPYLEVKEKTLSLSDSKYEGFTFSEIDKVTTYLANGYTFVDLPGGTAEYTVVTSKSGYDTKVTSAKDENGDWVINVEMTYNPSNFDLKFTVKVHENVPAHYIPDAAIVKVTFWADREDSEGWEIITQQKDGLPGVRVDINPNTRSGSGTYPVWKYESNGTTPYGYRIEVTSFVYPDGTIVRADQVVTQDVAWSDKVYTATVDPVTDGKIYGGKDGLGGAYIGEKDLQVGTLNAVITMDLYSVTFDAQGGKVNGEATQTVPEQYKIPAFKDYIPTRDGGYTFGGWYLDEECTKSAAEGTDLNAENTTNGNITLYAKWIEPLTISGTVTIDGTYMQNGEPVNVHGIDKATEAIVVLQEIRNGIAVEIDSEIVEFGDYDVSGSDDYSFTGIPNDGKQYQIHVLELNYNTTYDNETEGDKEQYRAVFGTDSIADVDAHLSFVPPSYDQKLKVDAKAIGEGFRPTNVLAEVMYRDTGDNHPYTRISQHDVGSKGIVIDLTDGVGKASQSVWNWHTDGTLYDYQMNITKVGEEVYDSDSAPYYILYTAANNAATPDVTLVAELHPYKYQVTFDLNAGTDPVTGMEAYAQTVGSATSYAYKEGHTWSKTTEFTAVPQRVGYTFKGWYTTVADVTTDEEGNVKIDAKVHESVVLTAQWEKKTYTVTTAADPEEGGATEVEGTGPYDHDTGVTVKATPNPGYTFKGWWENGEKVSDDAEFTFSITKNRNLTAKFVLNKHTVVIETSPAEGGKTAGAGAYDYGAEVTLVATANPGYTFVGWKENGKLISSVATWTIDRLTEDREFVAEFKVNQYEVDVQADPENAGTVSGNGIYNYGQKATLTANENTGYEFVGWFDASGNQVSDKLSFEVRVTEDLSYVANFEAIKCTVDTSASPEVGGTTGGDGTYEHGATATVVATANRGYKFMGWFKENGEKVSEEASYSFTVTADCTLEAQFGAVEITEYTITTIAFPENAGTLTGGGTYIPTDSVTITAEAKSGYCFIGWYDEDDKFITAKESYTLTVKGNRTFTAKFETEKTYRYDDVYLFGYNNSEIGAEGPLLRSEVAQMIYRLVRQNGEPKSTGKVFADTSGQWFQSGIAYMAQKGAIDSTKDKAYPYVAVTRGETYKMLCLGLGYTSDTSLRLSQYAAILENHGFNTPESSVSGTIKRYEFCELFNEILGRTGYSLEYEPGKEITPETYGYKDLKTTDSYYRTMMIATSTFKEGKVDVKGRIDRNTFDYNR